MTERILLCNAGSSSLKLHSGELPEVYVEEAQFNGSQAEILSSFGEFLLASSPFQIVLHRIVHAGAVGEEAAIIDEECRAQIKHWSSLAPLHNAIALKLVDATMELWPQSQQFAVFDSGLFAELPAVSRRYAIAADISPRWPVQRYGFHGLAHRSQMRILQSRGRFNRVITLQLGGGTSAAAWRDGKVIDTTMGYTPLEGLPMGSRSGSVDPGILLHLMQNEDMSPESIYGILQEQSGLKALSGGISDMRELLVGDTESARFAIEFYCYQLRKVIGSYVGILGGIDAVTVGGGIAENQPEIRRRVFSDLSHLSLVFQESANASAEGVSALHEPDSPAQIWLTPVDEAGEMLCQFKNFKHLHRL